MLDGQPGDPSRRYIREGLPDVRGPRRPTGYKLGWQFGERLAGLGLVLLGIAGAVIAFTLVRSFPAFGETSRGVTPASPLQCLMPFTLLGSAGLVVVGLRKMVFP